MESKNKQQEEYEYSCLIVPGEDGYGNECYIDELLDCALEWYEKEDRISFLNDIIRDIEHYRDSLE